MIGAGIIGTGGAIAESGYLISVCTLIGIAGLTKKSLDMLIELEEKFETSGYEDLGEFAFGRRGKMAVIISKFVYSLGCMVAYVVVLKNNMSSSLTDLLDLDSIHEPNFAIRFLKSDEYFAIFLSLAVILPLCLLRNLDKLAKFSIVSILSVLMICSIVLYEFIYNPNEMVRLDFTSWEYDIFTVRVGYVSSIGTFVFAFVSQHCSHMAYRSLRNKSLDKWKKVSSYSISIALTLVLIVGSFVYFSFWRATTSDMFGDYPNSKEIDIAQIFLSVTMLLSFPLPFFTCREMVIIFMMMQEADGGIGGVGIDGREICDSDDEQFDKSLLSHNSRDKANNQKSSNDSREGPLIKLPSKKGFTMEKYLVPNDRNLSPDEEVANEGGGTNHVGFQLKTPYHILLTVTLCVIAISIAVAASSLGAVLDLVGCLSGTAIAFIIPAAIQIKMGERVDVWVCLMLSVGLIIGLVGTAFSLKKAVEGG